MRKKRIISKILRKINAPAYQAHIRLEFLTRMQLIKLYENLIKEI